MSVSDRYVLTLMEASTGFSGVYTALTFAKDALSRSANEHWVFFGTIGKSSGMTKEKYDNLTDEDKAKYVERTKVEDGVTTYSYYWKERDFNIVPGYEEVDLADSPDKNIYHPRENTAPGQDGANLVGKDMGEWLDIKDTTVKDGKLIDTTTRWSPVAFEKKEITTEGTSTYVLCISPQARFMDTNGPRNFEWGKDYEGLSYWPLTYVNVDAGRTVPWTMKNRLGVIKASYTGEADADKNLIEGYTISNADPSINGKLPGIDY